MKDSKESTIWQYESFTYGSLFIIDGVFVQNIVVYQWWIPAWNAEIKYIIKNGELELLSEK